MSSRESDLFEAALEQASRGDAVQGRMAPLMQTTQQLAILADTPPLPPYRLAPGRQQLLSEAARLRAESMGARPTGLWRTRLVGLATAFAAVILVLGLIFGAGCAAADSVPGEPFYGVKLAIEGVRISLTTDAQSVADLHLSLADERLGEVLDLLADEHVVGREVAHASGRQLEVALRAASELDDAASSQALGRLVAAIQHRQRSIQAAVGAAPDPPLLDLLREMERVRSEAQAGQGDPEALRERLGGGAPAEPALVPDASQTPQPAQSPESRGPEPTGVPERGGGWQPAGAPYGPAPTEPPRQESSDSATGEPSGPERTGQPGQGPGDRATDEPNGPKRAGEPWRGPVRKPTAGQGESTPAEAPGEGHKPTVQPGGSDPSDGAGSGTGPQPTTGPGAPSPTGEPGPESGAQATDEPGDPGPGPGSGPTDPPGGRGP